MKRKGYGLQPLVKVQEKAWRISGLLLLASVAFGQQSQTAPNGTLTFSHDVAPILYKHCVACHHPGDIAPMSLLTYKEARPWAAAIRQAVVSRKMPPWLADPNVGHWTNDPRLTDSEIQTIRAWVEGPKLEGDPKEMPAAPPSPTGGKSASLTPYLLFRPTLLLPRVPTNTHILRCLPTSPKTAGSSPQSYGQATAKLFITRTSL